VGTGDVAETRDCDGQGQAAGDGTARDPYGAPATGRDKVAATAALVMARTSTNVPAASAVTAWARLRSSGWPCRSTTALLLAVRCPDRGLVLG
jgi:hypothetical protein